MIFVAQLTPPLAVLGLLAYFARIHPHRPMVLLALVPALLSVGLLAWPEIIWPVLVCDVVVITAAVADLTMLPRKGDFAVERETVRVASLGKPHQVTLLVVNRSNRRWFGWIRDGAPQELNATPAEFHVILRPRSRSTLIYRCHSRRRGAFRLTAAHLKVRSRMGLWQRLLDYRVETVLHVYPDLKQLSEYALLARTDRLSQLGVRRTRRIGEDNEFERLRDYTPDDNFKHIDWRSTARRAKLTVKDFQRNQSQRLMFLIDTGRMMTNEAAGLSLLDHALNAMLMLSYVALSHGDSVGLLCFSDEVHHYVPPRGGRSQMNRLLHAVFDRFPRLVESRYDQAFLHLGTHCRKRSLVVLISNIVDEVNSNQVESYLTRLAGRHLPVAVWLRDRRTFDYADTPAPRGAALYRAAAAAEILTWRHQVLAELASKGVLALDVFPEELTAPLVNQYLEVKARHLL